MHLSARSTLGTLPFQFMGRNITHEYLDDPNPDSFFQCERYDWNPPPPCEDYVRSNGDRWTDIFGLDGSVAANELQFDLFVLGLNVACAIITVVWSTKKKKCASHTSVEARFSPTQMALTATKLAVLVVGEAFRQVRRQVFAPLP